MNAQTAPLPIRYRRDRPYGPDLDIMAQELASGHTISDAALLRCCQSLARDVPPSAAFGTAASLQGTTSTLMETLGYCEALGFQEAFLARAYVRHASAGGQVVEIDARQANEFTKSTPTDLAPSDLQLPNERIYVHFSAPIAVGEIGKGKVNLAPRIDGAYIERLRPDLIAITTSNPQVAAREDLVWMSQNAESIPGIIYLRLDQPSLADATAQAVADYVSNNQFAVTRLIDNVIEQRPGRPLTLAAREMLEGSIATYVNRLLESGQVVPVVRQVVNLAANTIRHVITHGEAIHRVNANAHSAVPEEELAPSM